MGGQEEIFSEGRSEGGNLPFSPMKSVAEDDNSFVLLTVSGETFAIDIKKVREIVRVPKITWVPGAPDSIKGVINLRGGIVPVVELASALSLGTESLLPTSRIVVVEAGERVVGLMVDEVSRVTQLNSSQMEPALATLDSGQRSIIAAQSIEEDLLIGILDLDQLVENLVEA